ncbi:NTF2 fold immunity protein [Xylanibacter oryzae]|uniref:NTF2 fold immunity protein n=1 Tax=Xylanibacter oryzae TaxID=185293 RepID=UPI0004B28D66|nr:NTF2 fold immunity protein [Xylanibacter oryzae]
MKKITTIIIFLVGIILGIFIKSEYDIVKSKNVVVKEDFIFKGNVKVDKDITEERKLVDDTYFKSDIDTMGVYGRTNGIIPNAKSAAGIAKIILNYCYGEGTINKEKPFNVELVNNRVWYIYGSLPKNSFGGAAQILIQKSDGKVLGIFHGK